MKKVYEQALTLLNRGQDCVLAEIIAREGSAPRKTGSAMVITMEDTYDTIGGGLYEYESIRIAREELLPEQKSIQKHFDMRGKEVENAMICGGVIDVRLRYLSPEDEEIKTELAGELAGSHRPRVFLFGAGHVAYETAQVLDFLDFSTVVLDDRAEFVNVQRYPHSQVIVLEDFEKLEHIKVCEADYILILTRGHAHDKEVLQWALCQKVRYIGMIGSIKKRDTLYHVLQQDGISRELLTQVHCPVGLAIGAETPKEIAISIAGEIIAVANKD